MRRAIAPAPSVSTVALSLKLSVVRSKETTGYAVRTLRLVGRAAPIPTGGRSLPPSYPFPQRLVAVLFPTLDWLPPGSDPPASRDRSGEKPLRSPNTTALPTCH